jgi:hypothetical protein
LARAEDLDVAFGEQQYKMLAQVAKQRATGALLPHRHDGLVILERTC